MRTTAADRGEATDTALREERRGLGPTAILVVDDEKPVRKLMRSYLEEAGHQCHTAASVAEALARLETQRYDLVLSDIQMPGASGLELIREVNTRYPHTAVVVASVLDNPARAREILELGVYGYIVKPFTRNGVRITVDNALRRHGLERQNQVHQAHLREQVAKATAALNHQVVFLQSLMDAIPSPIYAKDGAGVFQSCNTAFEAFLGRQSADIIGKTAEAVFPGGFAAMDRAADMALPGPDGKQSFEARFETVDGGVRHVIVSKSRHLDKDADGDGSVSVIQDITARKAVEAALMASEEKLSSILENMGVGVATISPDMEILWMNEQMGRWFPHIDLTANPTCYRAFNTPARDTICDYCPTIKTFETGKRHEAVTTTPMPDGVHHFRLIATPIHDKQGEVVAAIELVEDITERISLERELQQAQKLESIGQLAAGIAHEINTPIQYIGDNTSFLGEAFADIQTLLEQYAALEKAVAAEGRHAERIRAIAAATAEADLDYLVEEVPQALDQTLEGVQRVSTIVQAMREFSHPGSEQKVATDLNQALNSTITVARNEWKYVADMETAFADDLPLVACNPGEVNQVFLNLIINAAHAIAEATDAGRRGKGVIAVSTEAENDAVVIRVRDTGKGIPEEIQPRVLDPFFTTKPVGKGTGQGLAIAHSVVVDKHGGSLRFETEANRGTTFIIRLPIRSGGDPGAPQDA